MSIFDTCTSTSAFKPLDPAKRVNYRFGLVLGADEFMQEDTYLRESDWLAVRALFGYGTVAGLKVEASPAGSADPEVKVLPGLAVNPRGQFMSVNAEQCARLNTWLSRVENRRKVAQGTSSIPVTGSPPPPAGTQRLFVVLNHEECETDPVAVPGGPCRTQEDSVAASRVSDNFRLSFEVQPPQQLEERIVRELGTMIGTVEVTNSGTAATDADVQTRVRQLTPFGGGAGNVLRFPVNDAARLYRLAIRTWITEIRTRHMTASKNAHTGPSNEAGVMLAELRFTLTGGWQVQGGNITVDDSNRPLLLHARALQEWLMVIGV